MKHRFSLDHVVKPVPEDSIYLDIYVGTEDVVVLHEVPMSFDIDYLSACYHYLCLDRFGDLITMFDGKRMRAITMTWYPEGMHIKLAGRKQHFIIPHAALTAILKPVQHNKRIRSTVTVDNNGDFVISGNSGVVVFQQRALRSFLISGKRKQHFNGLDIHNDAGEIVVTRTNGDAIDAWSFHPSSKYY